MRHLILTLALLFTFAVEAVPVRANDLRTEQTATNKQVGAAQPRQTRAHQPRITVRVRYVGYYYGARTPSALADVIEAALRRDPSGMTQLDAAKCRRDGSCARPVDYVTSLQAHDPQGRWSLENLVAGLRRLQLRCGIEGVWQMDRIELNPDGSVHRADLNGMSRAFNRGSENRCAWVNPDTGRPVIAPDCTNPVGIRIDLDCVYHDIEVRDPSEFSLVWARYDAETDECFAWRRVDRLYQADSPTAMWHSMPRGCIGRPCDLSADNAVLGMEQMTQGQIPVEPGRYQVRVARNAFLVYCLKFQTVNGVDSSFAVGVRWQQDYRLVGREWHARIYYESDQMLAEGRRLNGPGGIALYASNPRMEEMMRAGQGR